jgi:tetratricopeptide (TPR) repeat protein
MTEADAALRHFIEQVRLLMGRDPVEGFKVWSALYTELAQGGLYDVCEELLLMVKGMDLPPYGLGIVRYGEGWMYDRSGHWMQAIAAYEAALVAFDDANMPLQTQILTQIGSLYQDQGDWARAGEAYDRALAAADDDHGRALILNNLGGLSALRGDQEQARCHFVAAKAALGATGDRYNYAAAGVGLASVLRDEGRLQDSVDQLVEAVLIFRDLGDARALATGVAGLALTYHMAGRQPEAAQTYQTALEIFLSIKDRSGIAKTLANLALLSADAGGNDEALAYLEQAVAEYREIGDQHGEALAVDQIARLSAVPRT